MDGKRVTHDPMQMPHWSLGIASVWIHYRSPNASARLWNAGLEDALLTWDDGANNDVQDARQELCTALSWAELQATGLNALGERCSIPALDWEDITLNYEPGPDGLQHRADARSGQSYTHIRVDRRDVLRLWPETDRKNAKILQFDAKRRGPKPSIRERVKQDMRAHGDMADLSAMTEEAMSATFDASRDTCRIARREVLSEFSGGENLDN